MPGVVEGARLTHLPKKSGTRSRRQTFPFLPACVRVSNCVADHPGALRLLTTLPDVETDIVEDLAGLKPPTDGGRALHLAPHRGRALKACACGAELGCGLLTLDVVAGSPIELAYSELEIASAEQGTTTVSVDLERVLAEASRTLARDPSHFVRVRVGSAADALALDPITEISRVLIPFFAQRRNALLELVTRTTFVDHLLELKHRNRTVIAWPLNTAEVIAGCERGSASLEERLAAAARAAAAGFGVAFHLDPIIVQRTPEEAVASWRAVIEQMLAAIPERSIAWVSLGCLRCPIDLPARSRKRFPETRIFDGELVPVGSQFRYPRFVREQVLGPLWEQLAEKLPTRKLTMCGESIAVWRALDPGVTDAASIEKRLCNLEALPMHLAF